MNKYGLKREILIDIINKHNNDDNTILSLLKEEFKFYEYYQDKRFMPELKSNINMQWRQDFLKDEAIRRIEQGDIDFAYKNLFELIRAENPALYGTYLHTSCFINESDKQKHEDYYKDGYICEKEKNIIMEIINAIELKDEINVIKTRNQSTNYLKLETACFGLKEDKSNLSIHYDEKQFISINIDMFFEDGEYNNLDVSPHIEINNIKTSANKLNDLKGILFEINDVNESYDRGDNFYLYESEPFIKYKIEILEIDEQNAHIKLNGIGITDGYSSPYKTENLIVDAIVPIKIYNNSQNKTKQQETNHFKNNNKIFKEKTKHLVKSALFGLMFGFTGFMLLMEFFKTNNILYIIISLMMFLVMLLCLAPFYERFIFKKKKNVYNDKLNFKLETDKKYNGVNIVINFNTNESKEHLTEDYKVLEKEGIENLIKNQFMTWLKGEQFKDRDDNRIYDGLKLYAISYKYGKIIDKYSPTGEENYFGQFQFSFESSNEYTKDMLESVTMQVYIFDGKIVKVSGFDD